MKKQMIHIPFADHHPPPLVQFFETVTMIDAWLRSSPEHVAIIHCVGGKGRTGTIISALMFYGCIFATVEDSADHFAKSRSMLGRGVLTFTHLLIEKRCYSTVSKALFRIF